MRIYLASDHAGLELKKKVKAWLKQRGYTVYDEGAFEYNEADDYPDFVRIVAKQIASNPEESRGIIFGKSGQGEAMAANRFIGVRAAVYYGGPEEIVALSREHNSANILSLGAHFLNTKQALEAIKLWLNTDFSAEERHRRRVSKIDNLIKEEHQF
jgi:ribose 5-phosphate isomerase B